MRTIISFDGRQFPPSFGYLEAYTACEEMNMENPAWNIMLQFNATSNFSFSSFNTTLEEFTTVVMAKMIPLYGPPQLPLSEFPETINMAEREAKHTGHLPPAIWKAEQLY